MVKKQSFASGNFVPSNPKKYVGKGAITYRSSWELTFMNLCDRHPNIEYWASEPIKIPYKNPFTGKNTVYIPDFMMVYTDGNGKKQAEIIEIKPARESYLAEAKTKRDKAAVALNMVKWQAAEVWSKMNGFKFRVMTEEQIYRNASGSNKGLRKPVVPNTKPKGGKR